MVLKFNAVTGRLDMVLDLTNPVQFKGAITIASDFPTSAAVQAGWMYRVLAPVTDNDPTKTNTGQSFLAGDEIIWDGVSAWISMGSTLVWANIGGTQTDVEVGGFSNTIGYLVYADTISAANYATSAGSAGDAAYATSVGVLTGHNISELTDDLGFGTFELWKAGTPYTPTGACEFNNGSTTYAKYYNLSNGCIAEWSDGTYTFKIGQPGTSSYIAGVNDVVSELDGTYVQNIDAGSMIPSKLTTTKDAVNTVIVAQELERATTGTATAGIGVAQDYYVENGAGTRKLAAALKVSLTDVTDSAEHADVTMDVIKAGSLQNRRVLFNIVKIRDVTDTDSVLASDETIVCNKSTGFALTLPPATTAIIGQIYSIKNIGAGDVTLTADTSGTADLIDGQATQTISQWENMIVQCYAADKWGIM